MFNFLRRAWGYARYGINNFVGWLVSLTAYITIIYEFIPGLKAILPVYVALPVALVLILVGSGVVGYFLIKHVRAWGGELEIGAEAQPYNYKLLAGKERLSWELMYQTNQIQINELTIWEGIYPNHGFGELRARYEEIQKKIVIQLNAKGDKK